MTINTSFSNKFYGVSIYGDVDGNNIAGKKIYAASNVCPFHFRSNPIHKIHWLNWSIHRHQAARQSGSQAGTKRTPNNALIHMSLSYLTENENNKWKYYCRLNACLFSYIYIFVVYISICSDLCWLVAEYRPNICMLPAPHFPFNLNLIWCDLIYCLQLWGSSVHKIVYCLLHERIPKYVHSYCVEWRLTRENFKEI